jgi:hypothetical protein
VLEADFGQAAVAGAAAAGDGDGLADGGFDVLPVTEDADVGGGVGADVGG